MNVNDEIELIPKVFDSFLAVSLPYMLGWCQRSLPKNRDLAGRSRLEREMSEYPETMDHMLAAWNERSIENVRSHLERALSGDVRFVDPANEITGLDAFEKMVCEFRRKFPVAVCSRSSEVDAHHNLYRYHWAIHSENKLLLPGFDVVETDASGKVAMVLGFFGQLAPAKPIEA